MHVEMDLEGLFKRLVPGCETSWVGASAEEIEEIENFVGQPLPSFYRWFLTKMGRSMGALANPRRDMSVETLLAIYRGHFSPPKASLMLVASEADDLMPMYMYCDLDHQTREDALVCSYEQTGGPCQIEFETLREQLAWGAFLRSRIRGRAQRCDGTFRDVGRDVLGSLEPVLESLHFETLHRTGPYCGLYERPGAALLCMVPPGDLDTPYIFFKLAGDDLIEIRSILGTIAVETSLAIEVRRWTPPPPMLDPPCS